MIEIQRLRDLYDKGIKVRSSVSGGGEYSLPTADRGLFSGWKTQVLNYLKNEIGEESLYFTEFNSTVNNVYLEDIESGLNILNSIIEDVAGGHIVSNTNLMNNSMQVAETLEKIFQKFHKCTRKLRGRYDSRNTIDINDEYDVQDLLGLFLEIHFDDIRPEEYTPSYAGSSARMDFLLKNEKTVIEVKMTRKSLKDKELGNQLIEDIARYRSHPDCEKLICFVYDPVGYISNPKGLENDLSKSNGIEVQVYIRP